MTSGCVPNTPHPVVGLRPTRLPRGSAPLRRRLAGAVAVAVVGVGLGLETTPAQAAPQPVTPSVTRTALTGVDGAALATVPAAFDPDAVAAAARVKAGAVARPGRVRPDRRPNALTSELPLSRLSAAGVSWTLAPGQRASDVVVQVRLKEHGTWSDWEPLSVIDGPDPDSADALHAGSRVGTEPITSAAAEALQVRVDSLGSAPASGLQLTTVDPGATPADVNAASAARSAATAAPAAPVPSGSAAVPGASETSSAVTKSSAAVGQPAIVTRAQWGADESLRTCSPSYSSTIKAGFVHHTVNSNSYQPSDSPALVRAIYAYHVKGNGWCDVGYQFLVDRFGTIFEGRYGGMDRPVVGAHAGGFNTNTFGVSGIGDFTSAQPPQPMLDAFTRVIGWKLSLHGVDPKGTTVLTSAGGSATGYAAGAKVTVRTVSGHRDVDLTDCPGDALYSRLGSLANAVSQYLATSGPGTFSLPAGRTLVSPDGRYTLAMQTDGNLVVYGPTGATWATGTFMPYSYATLQTNGNLAVLDRTDGSVVWTTNTTGAGAHLEMQNDGNLVLYSGSGAALWDSMGCAGKVDSRPAPTKTVLVALAGGQDIFAPNRAYRLVMQADGNLVSYDASGRVMWATGTFTAGSRIVMQGDGNLVIYSAQGRAVWASNTEGNTNAFALLGNDGRFGVYRTDGARVWGP